MAPEEISQLIHRLRDGDEDAAEQLFPAVYQQLHQLASNLMARERQDHTLQPTALINEAFLRLAGTPSTQDSDGTDQVSYQDLNHFIGVAAVAMRRILINHAKAKNARKRGGDRLRLELDDVAQQFSRSAIDLLALDEAMQRLREQDETQHRLVELRFFGGMTISQAAEALGISERSAYYEWSHARAWLHREIGDAEGGSELK